jgi:predicted NACHT family NTPase
VEYEERREPLVLEQILRATARNRFWLILGEPGSGKTTLLETWFKGLASRVAEPYLGAMVPALVRLRLLPTDVWKRKDEIELADALWECAVPEKALLDGGLVEAYAPKYRRNFHPIWLLDGLDELLPETTGDESFFQGLANLPGIKVISARTAVFESQRKLAERYKLGEYDILGLRAPEQNEFLRKALPGDPGKADKLSAGIQQNTQVRLLATNPLMLSLMAEAAAGSGGGEIALPASRAEFYRRAVDEMWHRKLKTDPAALSLREDRDEYLSEKAATMGLDTLRVALSSKTGKNLERGLRKSGLLRVDDITGTFEFVHLTFQEHYLARSLAKKSLKAALQKYWMHPRFEETLALVISILFQEKRSQEIPIAWSITHAIEKKAVCSSAQAALTHFQHRVRGRDRAELFSLLKASLRTRAVFQYCRGKREIQNGQ